MIAQVSYHFWLNRKSSSKCGRYLFALSLTSNTNIFFMFFFSTFDISLMSEYGVRFVGNIKIDILIQI